MKNNENRGWGKPKITKQKIKDIAITAGITFGIVGGLAGCEGGLLYADHHEPGDWSITLLTIPTQVPCVSGEDKVSQIDETALVTSPETTIDCMQPITVFAATPTS